MIIYNAKIYPVDSEVIPFGYIEFSNGKITAVKSGNPPKTSAEDFDACGGVITPGYIDGHSHIGLIGEGGGFENEDINEENDPITPHLRTIDGLSNRDGYFKDAIESGVTTSVTGVGSANPIGGDFIAVKSYGRTADEMMIKQVGIKFALGENPKVTYSEKDMSPVTRMATAGIIRETLYKARRYKCDKEDALKEDEELPEYDIKLEALIPLLDRKIKAFFHCHRADDIMTAVRISEEFSLDYVLIHCTEGYIIPDILKEKGAKAVVGPIICDRGKAELAKLTVKNAGILAENDVPLAICTDHPEVPVQYLGLSAALCVKNGLSTEKALEAITINSAKINGIEDRVGSLSVGKDADIVLWGGEPLDFMSEVIMTIIDGEIIYRKK